MTVEEGFLADEVQAVRTQIRERYAEWYELFRGVNARANEVQYSIAVHVAEQRELYGAALFARTIASNQAAVLLLEFGLVAQARCVLRSSLETFFSLAALAESSDILAKLLASHEAEQRRAASNVTKWKDPALKAIADAEKASGRLDPHLASTAVAISTYDLALASDNEDLYRTLYMSLSWSIHGAAVDLERHVLVDSTGSVTGMRNEPEIAGQEASWLVAVLVDIYSIGALSKIFPGIDLAVTEEHERITKQLASELES